MIPFDLLAANNNNHDNLDENQGCNLGNQLDETLVIFINFFVKKILYY